MRTMYSRVLNVTLNGTTEVQVGDANGWLRVFRAFVLTAGSAGTAAGTILIQTTRWWHYLR